MHSDLSLATTIAYRMLVSFPPPQLGTFRMSLQVSFMTCVRLFLSQASDFLREGISPVAPSPGNALHFHSVALPANLVIEHLLCSTMWQGLCRHRSTMSVTLSAL